MDNEMTLILEAASIRENCNNLHGEVIQQISQISWDRCQDDTNNSKCISDTSNSVIEDSDVESNLISRYSSNPTMLPNVTVNSSTDEDINTSTVQFPGNHIYFTGKDSSLDNTQQTTVNTITNAKINIISNVAVHVDINKENKIMLISKRNEIANPLSSIENQKTASPVNISQISTSKMVDASTPTIEQQSSNTLDIDRTSNSPISPPNIPQTKTSSVEQEQSDYLDIDQQPNCISPVAQPVTSPSLISQIDTQIMLLPSSSSVEPQPKSTVKVDYKLKNRKKREASSKFKKECLDFASDEEKFIYNEDFSSGSSDNWRNSETELITSSDSDESNNKKRKKKIAKKTRKNTLNEEKVVCAIKEKKINKRKSRKELKDQGKAYETHTGKAKEARSLKKNPCVVGKCPRKCFDVSDDRRKAIFDYYWALDNQRKKDWLICHTKRMAIKRKKTKNENSRREKSYEYYINDGEGRRPVCQQFILNTLDITQKYLLYTVQNEEIEGLGKEDKRKTNVIERYDEETKQSARQFLGSLAAVPSHYCRKSSKRLFLPQELKNVTNLHSIYKNERTKENKPFLSQRLFINIFHTEYNYSFHVPKKDKCTLCTQHENNPDDVNIKNFNEHKKEKEVMQARFHFHQQLRVPGNTTVVASFDLQKVLNTPYGESMLLYYSRKYAVYNCTVYESVTQNGYCYAWGECDGKRGSNDIASCLFKYLKEVDIRGVHNLILYCDSCSGQNKNKTILSLLRFFLILSKNLATVQINYLLPGHTYMPVDSVHATIEKEVRKLTVWAPSQWPTFMQSARKNPRSYNVDVLDHKDFINFETVTAKTITQNVAKNKNFRMRDVKVVTFKKKDLNVMAIKYSMDSESVTYPIQLNEYAEGTKGKGRGKTTRKSTIIEKESQLASASKSWLPSHDLKPLYQTSLPIAEQKYKDLKRLCDNGTIPKRFHNEYLTLPHSEMVTATLPETDDDESSEEN